MLASVLCLLLVIVPTASLVPPVRRGFSPMPLAAGRSRRWRCVCNRRARQSCETRLAEPVDDLRLPGSRRSDAPPRRSIGSGRFRPGTGRRT